MPDDLCWSDLNDHVDPTGPAPDWMSVERFSYNLLRRLQTAKPAESRQVVMAYRAGAVLVSGATLLPALDGDIVIKARLIANSSLRRCSTDVRLSI